MCFMHPINPYLRRYRNLVGEDGSGEGRDQEDRECEQQAGDILEAARRAVQEGKRVIGPVRCGGRGHCFLKHREALRILECRVRMFSTLLVEFSDHELVIPIRLAMFKREVL